MGGPLLLKVRHLVLPPVLAVGLALLVVGILLVSVGVDPFGAGEAMLNSSFGTPRNFGEVLIRATPLLLIAVTLVPSLRAGLYNIGSPGQMGAGALAATLVALAMPGQSNLLVLICCALAAAAAGTAVAIVPGALKAYVGVNEIISTLAINFIMLAVLGYLLNGPMQSDFANLPQSDVLPPSASLPVIIPDTRAHVGLILALALVPLLFLADRSRMGYKLRVFGANPQLLRQARVSRTRYVIGLMAVGGFGAGLAGWVQVAGVDHRLYQGIAEPVGYAGLFVALLGLLHPLGIVVSAIALGFLLHGGDSLQVGAGVSPEIVQVLLGLVLLAYAARPPTSAPPVAASPSQKEA